MQEVDIAVYKKKAIAGIVALSSRTLFMQGVAFGGTFLLTVQLAPEAFGIYGLVSAIVGFLGYFSDIGFAAALIQKKDSPTEADLRTVFTLQQVLVISLCLIAFALTPVFAWIYNIENQGIFLFWSIIISFFLSSLKTIPSVLLERELNFKVLIIPQLIETVLFYAVAVSMAFMGFGVISFAWAVLVRGVSGLVAIYVLKPWQISIGVDKKIAKKLMQFGFPFQINSILALIKDDLLTLVLGFMLTPTALGYIVWAKKWSEFPLRLIMDSVIRITFPAFSRVQHHAEVLKSALEKTSMGISLLIVPITVLAMLILGPMVEIIPKYLKWQPALGVFYLFSISSLIASLNTPLTNALMAIGRVRVSLYLMIFWTIASWIATIGFISLMGFSGVAAAQVVVGLSVFLVAYLVKRETNFSLFGTVWPFLLSGVVMLAFGQGVILAFSVQSSVSIFVAGLIAMSIYAMLIWALRKKQLIQLFVDMKNK